MQTSHLADHHLADFFSPLPQMRLHSLPFWTRRSLSISSHQTSAGDEEFQFVGAISSDRLTLLTLSGPVSVSDGRFNIFNLKTATFWTFLSVTTRGQSFPIPKTICFYLSPSELSCTIEPEISRYMEVSCLKTLELFFVLFCLQVCVSQL